MTTIPTPAFYALLCLASFGLGALSAVLFVVILMFRFEQEARQRKKRETEQMHRSIETYLSIGGK
jgi:hypothetical protein